MCVFFLSFFSHVDFPDFDGSKIGGNQIWPPSWSYEVLQIVHGRWVLE